MNDLRAEGPPQPAVRCGRQALCSSPTTGFRSGSASRRAGRRRRSPRRYAGSRGRGSWRSRRTPAAPRPCWPAYPWRSSTPTWRCTSRSRWRSAPEQLPREHDVDVLVCVGGGSTTGLAKAVALTTGLPIVAVPTTYAGSEATDVWGLTEARPQDHRASTGGCCRASVVYDASLMLGLPGADQRRVRAQRAGALRRLDVGAAHRPDRPGPRPGGHPRSARRAAPRRRRAAGELAGREQTLYGAYLAAVAFASAGSGLHHKICHVLGGMFDLPHAETHAVVLPHVLALNAPAVPDARRPDGRRVRRGLRARRPASAAAPRSTHRAPCATSA